MHLIRRAGAESGVRALRVVPGDVVVDFASEGRARQGHDREKARALVLHGTYESFDHRQAAVLADRAEALLDSTSTTPGPERFGRELDAVIGNQVTWSALDGAAHATEESHALRGSRLLLELGSAQRAPGVVVHDDGHPPTERPALGQGKRWIDAFPSPQPN